LRLSDAACRWLFAGLVLAWATAIPVAQAHEARPAYLEIKETEPGQYTILWRTPVLSGTRLAVVLRLPDGVRDRQDPVVQVLSDSILERRWIDAGPEGLAGRRIEFPGLELTITDAVVRAELLDGRTWMAIARPSQPWILMAEATTPWDTVFDFVSQGMKHILSGADHLLFVFGLLLIVRSWWMLVKTVTAFTVAHSITLAAATLGYVRPPAAPIEAAIAMSILFLGVEIVRAYRGGTSVAIRHPWIVAFLFGLLHGFGFAGALTAAGLPPTAVPLALVSFNVGVEFGQLAFVALVFLLAYIVRRLRINWPQPAVLLPAYAVGTFGAFWMIQRLAAM